MPKLRLPKAVLILLVVLAAGAAVFLFLRLSPSGRKARQMERAARYFEAGDLDKARIEYLNLQRADPENALVNRQLAMIWFDQSALFRALPLLQKASAASPADVELRRRLALSEMAAGNLAAAQKEAQEVLRASPGQQEALFILVDAALQKGEPQAAESYLAEMPAQTAAYHLAKMRIAVSRRDFRAAEASASAALAADANSFAAHLAVGEVHRARNEVAKAAAEYETAALLAPPRSLARLKLAEYKAQTGAFEEALALAKKAAAETPDYLPVWNLQAQFAVAQKKYEEALQILNNVFSRDHGNFEAQMLAAQIFSLAGDPVRATGILEPLSREYPNVMAVKVHLGRAYLQRGNTAAAVAAFTQAAEVNPDNIDAVLQLADLQLRVGEAQRVLEATTRVLKKVPNHPQAEILLAEAYKRLGKFDNAVEVYRSQMEAAPQNPIPHFMLGISLMQQKKTAEARQALEQASRLAPKDPIIVYPLIDLDLADKDYAGALQRVAKLEKETPGASAPYFLAARVYVAQEDWKPAEASLLKALEADPESITSYQLLIGVYRATKRIPEMIATMENHLVSKPGDAITRLALASLYEQQEEYPKARGMYEKILERLPEFVPALNNLAYLCSEQFNELEKARALATKARARAPENPQIADTLGWIQYRLGDYAGALALFNESAEKLAGNGEFAFHLGMANYLMGHRDAAREALKTAAASEAKIRGKDEIPLRLRLLESEPGTAAPLSRAEAEEILAQLPNDFWAQLRLGEAWEREGAPEKALAAYEAAAKINGAAFSPLLKLGRLQAGPLKNPAKAMEAVKKARALAPSSADLAVQLGPIAFQAGDLASAYSILQSAGERRDKDPEACYAYAWASYSVGRVRDAKAYLQRVVDLAPEGSRAAEARAFLSFTALLADPEALAAAEGDIEKRLAASPKDVPALMAKGALQAQRAERAAAIATYQAVLSAYPEFYPAKVELAALLLEDAGTRARAYEFATQAYKSDPSPRAARVLADVSFTQNDFSYALTLWQQSAKEIPLDSKRTYYTGLCYLAARDAAKARTAIEAALAGDLAEPLRSEARQKLAELEK